MEVRLEKRITVTIDEAIQLTGIGRKQLCVWINSDINFPSFKVGSKTMISVELLRKYLDDKAQARIGETTHSKRLAHMYASAKRSI